MHNALLSLDESASINRPGSRYADKSRLNLRRSRARRARLGITRASHGVRCTSPPSSVISSTFAFTTSGRSCRAAHFVLPDACCPKVGRSPIAGQRSRIDATAGTLPHLPWGRHGRRVMTAAAVPLGLELWPTAMQRLAAGQETPCREDVSGVGSVSGCHRVPSQFCAMAATGPSPKYPDSPIVTHARGDAHDMSSRRTDGPGPGSAGVGCEFHVIPFHCSTSARLSYAEAPAVMQFLDDRQATLLSSDQLSDGRPVSGAVHCRPFQCSMIAT